MKKILLSFSVLVCLSQNVYSQCAITSQPFSNCNYGYNISAFSLAGVASTGNAGCSANAYGNFTTPVRTLTLGIANPWSATTGGFYGQMGVGIWIDLNNDGFFGASEMLTNSAPATTHSGSLTVPLSATPGAGRKMRVRAASYNTPQPGDACNYISYFSETEDYLVDLVTPPPCTTVPPINSVVTPTYEVCANAPTALQLATTFTLYGYTYAWQSSTVSAVGPWTSIPSATLPGYTTPGLTNSTYYSVIMTCTNALGTTLATAGQVTVASTVVKTIPYFEGFENIAYNDQLPNCSWLVTNTNIAQTYTSTQNANRTACTGSRYATFDTYYQNATNYFYTNGLQMYAGVTYSASMWYKTNFNGSTNVTNLSLMLGTSQSTTGLVTIASEGPAVSGICKSVSGTFTVPSNGVYYIAVKGTSNGNYGTQYLIWDDLSVIIPCSLNSTSVTLAASQSTICSGQQVNLTVSGADTYTWNTGSNSSSLNELPTNSFMYTVVGTNTTTGCKDTQSHMVTVRESPSLVIFTDKIVSCSGSPVHLTAYGADTYTWSNSSNASNITVSPTVTTTYQLLGTNSFNCQSSATQQVSVVALPTVSAISSAPVSMCVGEVQMLTGSGANIVTYQWAANTLFIQSQTALVSPNVTTTYTLTGIDVNGCAGKTTIVQTVDICAGLNNITTTSNGVKVYPNPTAGFFVVELNSASDKAVEVTDITGRIILSTITKDEKVNVNIADLSNGIYYVRIQSDKGVDVIKVVKQ